MATPEPSQVTLVTQLLAAVPVIVGGAIGIVGTLSAARYGGAITEKRERRKERREKLEALVRSTYELEIWMKHEENWILFQGTENFQTNPLAMIETIGFLYFPQFESEVVALAKQVLTYRQWLIAGRNEIHAKKLAVVSQEHLATLESVYGPYKAAQTALVARSQKEMKALNAA